MKYLQLSLLLIVMMISCTSEDDSPTTPSTRPSTLSVSCNLDKAISYEVGTSFQFTIALSTDPLVGISSFKVEKGTTSLFEENSFTGNNANINFEYIVRQEDADNGGARLKFTLIDGDNRSVEETIDILSANPMSTSTFDVVCNRVKSSVYGVDEAFVFNVTVLTDPSVGIKSFSILNRSDVLFEQNDFTANNTNIEVNYRTTLADLDQDGASLIFTLVDGQDFELTKAFEINVAVDLPIIVEDFKANPAWNFSTDTEVSETGVADIEEILVSSDDGLCSQSFLVSNTGAKIYDISESEELDFFDINLSYGILENAINNVMPLDTLFYTQSGFCESMSPPIPIVVQLNNGELIYLDNSSLSSSKIGYRRRNF